MNEKLKQIEKIFVGERKINLGKQCKAKQTKYKKWIWRQRR